MAYSKNKRAYNRAKKNAAAPAGSYNFTDPDSRLMVDGATKSIVQAYNAQAAVDGQAQIIVAAAITVEVNDRHQLSPMLAAVEANTGNKPELATADTGYWDSETIAALEKKGFVVLVPPESQPGGELTASSPRNQWPKRCGRGSGRKPGEPNTASGKARWSRSSATPNKRVATASSPCSGN